MSKPKLSQSQLKKFRKDIAVLKSKGLVSKRVDARSQKPTRHMLKQVKTYKDVLSGKAKVIHTPKVKDAKMFASEFRVKGKSVVVPIQSKSVSVRFGKKTKEITKTYKTSAGKKITQHITPGGVREIKGKNVMYAIPIGNTLQMRDTWEDLVLFMEPYEEENGAAKPYKNWRNYVQIVTSK